MKHSVLWLRLLYELENSPKVISNDLKTVPEIAEAIELTRESAYTKAELEVYDKYWDAIRVEKTCIANAEARGELVGKEIGKQEEKIAVAINCFHLGLDAELTSKITSLTVSEVKKIWKENNLK